MTLNPMSILTDFLNKPQKAINYSVLRNIHSNPSKNHQLSYIDSIVNDNNFIASYSRTYQIKKQIKRIQAVSIIQNWFKKLRFDIKKVDNSPNTKDNAKKIKKNIQNQAAIKIQRFFKRSLKRLNAKKTNKKQFQNVINLLMQEIFEEKLEKFENLNNFKEFDAQIIQNSMNYFFYQNNRLKAENEHIKTNL